MFPCWGKSSCLNKFLCVLRPCVLYASLFQSNWSGRMNAICDDNFSLNVSLFLIHPIVFDAVFHHVSEASLLAVIVSRPVFF